MKFARTLGIVLSVALVPALAHAQAAPDQNPPDQNNPPADQQQPEQQPPQQQQPQQQPEQAPPPAPQATTSTSNNNNTPPVVVVNPNQPQPQPQPEAVQPNPQPAGPDNEEEEDDLMNVPVFTTGAVVFGGSYLASVIVADQSSHPGADRLTVPVVGPWLALSDWGSCPVDQPSCDRNTTDKVLLVADGVFQAAGLISMVDALVMPGHHMVYHRVADKGVHVAPTGQGVTMWGHF